MIKYLNLQISFINYFHLKFKIVGILAIFKYYHYFLKFLIKYYYFLFAKLTFENFVNLWFLI